MKHFFNFFTNIHRSEQNDNFSQNFTNIHTSQSPNTCNVDNELTKINHFIRTGLTVLSVILVFSIVISYGQHYLLNNTTTSGTRIANKKLPIYCVDQKEKKIALSFDAAWGESRLLKKIKSTILSWYSLFFIFVLYSFYPIS